jgi:hypothetical protein
LNQSFTESAPHVSLKLWGILWDHLLISASLIRSTDSPFPRVEIMAFQRAI